MKFLAFDIETAAILTDDQFRIWRRHRPLGITCVAAQASDSAEPILWDARQAAVGAPGRMTREQLVDALAYFERMVGQGYALLTWNGLGFDWDVLAEESGAHQLCRDLAMNHVDPLFHVFCDRGFPVSLEKAAQGHGLPGKPPGMAGFLAPVKWRDGHHQEVIDYVAQDVRTTLDVVAASLKRRSFRWITAKGKASSMPLPNGWLSVRAALQLPEPDTSWMSDPIPRSRFVDWLLQR